MKHLKKFNEAEYVNGRIHPTIRIPPVSITIEIPKGIVEEILG